MHQVWEYFANRAGYIMGPFNLLVEGNGLSPQGTGIVEFSISEFSLLEVQQRLL